MDSILNRPAIQLAAFILIGLFFLNQTRKRGLILSLLCLFVWLGAVISALGLIQQERGVTQMGGLTYLFKRIEIIDEIELVQLDPIINQETEQVVASRLNREDVIPNEAQEIRGSWTNVPKNVARWQPHIRQAIAHCGLVTPGYDPALLMAAIVMQESSGNPNASGGAHDTGLGQVVSREHPAFPNRPSREELLNPQINLNFAACLLRDNIKYTGSVIGGVNAYNGNGIHNGRTYAEIIFGHYANFIPPPDAPASTHTKTNFGSAPVNGRLRITQGYKANHPGLDITGAGKILAVMDGVVRYVGPLYKSKNNHSQCQKAGCLGGFAVVLDHGGGTFTVYGHNSCTHVEIGQSVKAGQPIACMGSEGRSTGPHLHFELRVNEVWNGNPNWPWKGSYRSAINPTNYLP